MEVNPCHGQHLKHDAAPYVSSCRNGPVAQGCSSASVLVARKTIQKWRLAQIFGRSGLPNPIKALAYCILCSWE